MTDTKEILALLSNIGQGQSEKEDKEFFAKSYLPLLEHLKALSVDKYFIIGERGTGKSELFRLAFQENLHSVLLEYFNKKVTNNIHWLSYQNRNEEFFDKDDLIELANGYEKLNHFWYLNLFIRILEFTNSHTELYNRLNQEENLKNRIEIFIENKSEVFETLNKIDGLCQEKGEEIVIGYDELDLICGHDVESSYKYIEGLFIFWSFTINRYKSFYPKIRFVYLTKKRKFQLENGKNIVFYYPGFDPIYKMIQTLKEKQGKIVLMIPPWSIHKPEEWNSVKIQLGIRKGWTFIYPNEL